MSACLCAHEFCVALAPVQHCNAARTLHGYCDHGTRARFLEFSAAYDEMCAGHFGSWLDQCTFAPCSDVSRYTRDYGQASSWYNRRWAPSTKQQTKNSYSGWSKRATRGYQSAYDGAVNSKPRNSTKDNEADAGTLAVADVEVVDDGDQNQGRAVADNVASSAAAHTTCDSAGATATDMDATRSRLGELHRLLNDRKGSFRATYKKNAEANDRAYDMNQKTIQVLDALAEEYSAFEASMKKVTSVHSQTRLDELERAHKDQDRLQDELDCSCEDMASCQGVFQQLGRTRSRDCKKQAAPSEKSATDVLPGDLSRLGKRGTEHTT